MTFRKSLTVALSTGVCLALTLVCLYALKTNSWVMPTDQMTSEEAKWLADQWVSSAEFDVAMSELDTELRNVDKGAEEARRSHQEASRSFLETRALFGKLNQPMSPEQEVKFKRLMSADKEESSSSP